MTDLDAVRFLGNCPVGAVLILLYSNFGVAVCLYFDEILGDAVCLIVLFNDYFSDWYPFKSVGSAFLPEGFSLRVFGLATVTW